MYQEMSTPTFDVRLAAGSDDVRAAQALRYDVFVSEGGATGSMVDHVKGLETDHFDDHCDHLLLRDMSLPEEHQVVGAYRLMTQAEATAAGGFYSAREFDLAPLLSSDRTLLELGRSCIRPSYRGGTALLHLWRGLGQYVIERDVDILFGVASLPGKDLSQHRNVLSYLFEVHAAPDDLCATALAWSGDDIALLPTRDIDRRAALTQMPSLIKSYLRLGGTIGQGVFVDHAFNTTDVCLVLEATRLTARQRALLEAA